MRMFKNILSKFFNKKNEDNEEQHDENFISEEKVGASIKITLDPESADFNVIVQIDDMSEECAFTLGSLLGMLNNGDLSPYFTQAYQNWSSNDHERQVFLANMLLNWFETSGKFSSEYDNVAVKPSQVFNFQVKQ